MKTLIVLVVGLLAVGCETPLPQRPKAKPVKELMLADQNSTKAEPAKELTPEQKQKILRDSVIGEYEFKHDEDTVRFIFLENGVCEFYINGKKEEEANWSIVDGEIHAKTDDGVTGVLRINPDKSITAIANIEDGKRTDLPKERQHTYKKIK